MAENNFREDLFYRINVLGIELPALRDREGDVANLISHFLDSQWHIDDAALRAMCSYSWPGNVRQLINVIQRATIMADGNEITLDDLPTEITNSQEQGNLTTFNETNLQLPAAVQASTENADGQLMTLDDITKVYIHCVLESLGGNKAKAARVLGIHRRKLYRLLERFESGDSNAQA